jgi:hypothetical protein
MSNFKPGYIQRIWNNFTDRINNEEGFIKWVSNVFTIGTTKTGSGTARDLEFDVGGSKLHIKTDGTIYLDAAGQTVGNARGAGAIDLQTLRTNATEVASGTGSIAIGAANKATTGYAIALGGGCIAAGGNSFASGLYSTASGSEGVAMGAYVASTGAYSSSFGRAITNAGGAGFAAGFGIGTINHGQVAFGFNSWTGSGTQQGIQQVLQSTSDSTPTIMSSCDTAGYRVVIPAKRACTVTGLITAYSDSTDGYKVASWEIKCVIERNASNVTRIVGTPTISLLAADADALTGGWAVTSITADDTNEALAITVTGEAGTNIRWQGSLFYGQVGYA